MLGMAEVFVLLLGEIDLSLGYSGAVGAAVMMILADPPINFGWGLAVPAGLATTTGIGFVQGQIVTRLRLPSFVVTLAGLLFWEGFLIWVINNQSPSNGGSIRITNTVIVRHRQRHPEPDARLGRDGGLRRDLCRDHRARRPPPPRQWPGCAAAGADGDQGRRDGRGRDRARRRSATPTAASPGSR